MENRSDTNQIEITVDPEIYPLEAVYGAAYVFIDRAYVFLDKTREGRIVIRFKSKEADKLNTEIVKDEFSNELLNYTHRIHIAKRNKKIREQIVERALFASVNEGAVADEGDSGLNEMEDPLGIAVPWEDKFGDSDAKNS